MQAANLEITDDEEYFTDAAAGSVINVRITPRDGGDAFGCDEGCTVHEKDTATIQVSRGPVPDVTDMTVKQATETLTGKGLKVAEENIYRPSDSIGKDRVIGYADRTEEGSWRPGETIQLIVSQGPPLFDVPDVSGMTRDEAPARCETPDSPGATRAARVCRTPCGTSSRTRTRAWSRTAHPNRSGRARASRSP